ncbi:MAG: hypothetical protein H0U58_07810, partial [Chloroflexi bacterium]|nr:hypothetical protein [Chloroflexota bacterium]
MSERPLGSTDEASLEIALRQLAAAIDWPTASPAAGPDLATLVRVRLIEREVHRRSGSLRSWRPTTGRRAVVLALAALLALAAVAGAVGLGLPGLRIILAEPSDPPPSVGPSRSPGRSPATGPSPSEVVSVPGSGLRLGRVTTLAEAEAATGLRIRLPSDPLLGPPDAVFVDRERA